MVEVSIAQDHVNLEHEFTKLCLHNGYKVADLSYHHNLPEHTIRTLRSANDNASLSVRLSPDLFITKNGKSMLCELKTGKNKDILRVEAYQLMLNQIGERYLKIPCLYVYCGKITDNRIVACHCSDICVDTLVIPNKKNNGYIEDTLLEYYDGDEGLRSFRRPKIDPPYSGDPYVEIPAEQV